MAWLPGFGFYLLRYVRVQTMSQGDDELIGADVSRWRVFCGAIHPLFR